MHLLNIELSQILTPSSTNKVSAKKFQCSYCDSKYSQKHNLKAHVKKFHDENYLKVDSSKAIESSQKMVGENDEYKEELQEDTGKSLLEALILASTNPKYDKRLFIDLPVQYMKTTSSEHVVYTNCFCFDIQNNLCTQHVLSL